MSKKRLLTIIIGAGISLFVLIVIMVLMAISSMKASAQEPYVADRPGMAVSAYSVGLHQLDYETSLYSFQYVNGLDLTTTRMQTNSFRYGAFKHLELRAGVNLTNMELSDGTMINGFRDVNLGIKMPFIRNHPYLPDIALFGTVILPNTGNVEFTPTTYLPSGALLLQKSFGPVTLIANGGVMWDSFTAIGYSLNNPNSINRMIQGTYALAMYVFVQDMGFFMETYGYYAGNILPYSAFDMGVAAMLKKNLQLDMSMGVSYDKGFDNSFFNLGLGWLIPNKNK